MNRVSPNKKEQSYFKEKVFSAKRCGIDLGRESLFDDIKNLKIFCWRSKLVNRRFNVEKGLKSRDEV